MVQFLPLEWPELHWKSIGYQVGVVSGSNIALNGNGLPASFSSSVAFDLESAYMTAAWYDGLNVTVTVFNGSTQVGTQSFVLSATVRSFVEFNFSNITSAVFTTSGGTQHPGYGSGGPNFAMDNLAVTFVPEPSTTVFAILAATATLIRRRRR